MKSLVGFKLCIMPTTELQYQLDRIHLIVLVHTTANKLHILNKPVEVGLILQKPGLVVDFHLLLKVRFEFDKSMHCQTHNLKLLGNNA